MGRPASNRIVTVPPRSDTVGRLVFCDGNLSIPSSRGLTYDKRVSIMKVQ